MLDLVPLGMALYASRTAAKDTIDWQVDGKLVRVTVISAPAAVAAQTKGIAGYLERVCGVDDAALLGRLSGVKAIYGLTAEASLDPTRAAARFWELARELDALVFHRGAFLDARGTVLAAPQAMAPGGEDDEDEDDDFDEDELDDDAKPAGPPSAERVAARAQLLAALGARALLEDLDDHEEGLERLEQLRAWITERGLEAELEEPEQSSLFEPTIGGMGRQERINTMWRFEGAVVLGWALGLIALPPHDTVVEVRPLLEAIGVSRATPPGIARPVLRPAGEILAMRQRIFSIHWRLVDFRLRPVALDFPDVARRSTFGLVTDPAMLVGKDLGVRGQPIAEADPRDVGLTSSIAKERHQAANWLVGDMYGPTYSRVGTDT